MLMNRWEVIRISVSGAKELGRSLVDHEGGVSSGVREGTEVAGVLAPW